MESHSFNYFGHLSCCCWFSGWGFLALKPAVVKFHRKSSLVLVRDCPNSMWAMGFGANCLGRKLNAIVGQRTWLGQVNENVGEIFSIERRKFVVIKRADFWSKNALKWTKLNNENENMTSSTKHFLNWLIEQNVTVIHTELCKSSKNIEFKN